jgi:hypothetical protein
MFEMGRQRLARFKRSYTRKIDIVLIILQDMGATEKNSRKI